MTGRRFNQLAWVILWVAAQARGEDQADTLHFLGRLDRPAALEPAGSRGSLGMALGAGGGSYAMPEDNQDLKNRLGTDGGGYAVPRAWVTKGLPWPVDLGLTAAAPTDGAFTQVTGYAQWTVYEDFAMPALSVRGSYGRLLATGGTEVKSTSFGAVASYGFLRYITVYASGTVSRHQGVLNTANGAPQQQETWVDPVRAAGLRVTVIPPFISATAEVASGPDGQRDIAAKLSMGM